MSKISILINVTRMHEPQVLMLPFICVRFSLQGSIPYLQGLLHVFKKKRAEESKFLRDSELEIGLFPLLVICFNFCVVQNHAITLI